MDSREQPSTINKAHLSESCTPNTDENLPSLVSPIYLQRSGRNPFSAANIEPASPFFEYSGTNLSPNIPSHTQSAIVTYPSGDANR